METSKKMQCEERRRKICHLSEWELRIEMQCISCTVGLEGSEGKQKELKVYILTGVLAQTAEDEK